MRIYVLEERPIKVSEPGQILGLIEEDLMDTLCIDTVQLPPPLENIVALIDAVKEFNVE